MVELTKGHFLVNVSRNSVKSLKGLLNIDPNSYAKYHNPSLRGFQDIVFKLGKIRRWMDDLRFYVLFNNVSVISGR